jgi:hypothetical protein
MPLASKELGGTVRCDSMDDDGDDFDFEPENQEVMGVLYALFGGWFLYIAIHMHLGFAGRPAKDVLARVFIYALIDFMAIVGALLTLAGICMLTGVRLRTLKRIQRFVFSKIYWSAFFLVAVAGGVTLAYRLWPDLAK